MLLKVPNFLLERLVISFSDLIGRNIDIGFPGASGADRRTPLDYELSNLECSEESVVHIVDSGSRVCQQSAAVTVPSASFRASSRFCLGGR